MGMASDVCRLARSNGDGNRREGRLDRSVASCKTLVRGTFAYPYRFQKHELDGSC